MCKTSLIISIRCFDTPFANVWKAQKHHDEKKELVGKIETEAVFLEKQMRGL